MHTSRSRMLASGAVALALALATPAYAAASPSYSGTGQRWSGTWATAPQQPRAGNDWDGPNWSTEGFAGRSVRQVVRVSTGGALVRIRLSNRYGTAPLRVTGASIAKTGAGAALSPGTVRPVTFGHSASTTIPAGQERASDATLLVTAPLEKLTVTLYFAGDTGPATFHEGGLTTTYRATGDHRSDRGAEAFAGETSHSWYYLTGVDTAGGRRPAEGAVVAFSDSITDRYDSTAGTDRRYPDRLAERLTAAGRPLGVLNAGIMGNLLLTDYPCYAGEKGVTRFARDALGRPGVRSVIVLEGINDLGLGGQSLLCGEAPAVTAPRLIAAYRAMIRAAHARHVRIIGATITPFRGHLYGYYTKRREAVRDAVNHWIRTGGEFDAVADLDRALADPVHRDVLAPAYDRGDHLHPNDAGMRAIAAAIDLRAL